MSCFMLRWSASLASAPRLFDEACGGDESLRKQVEALLAGDC
jgi:hypothetical protein